MARDRFDAVQVLRALAATLVVFEHSLMNWADKAIAPGAMPAFPHLGDYGVKLFFCISGFIILHTAAPMSEGWESAKTFWQRRLRRIVPLYWTVTTVYLAKLGLAGQAPALGEVVRSYLFVPYVNHQGLIQPVVGQGWSLNYEMLFYFVFGAMFFLPRRWLVPGVLAVMTALASARFDGLLGSSENPNALYHWADGIIMYFVAGVIACVVAQQWRSRKLPALSQGWAAFASLVIVIGYGGVAMPASEHWYAWMPLACLAPLLLCITARSGRLGAAWQPVIAAGDASYSTYLTHGFAMGTLARVLGSLSVTASLGYYGFAWLCVLACTTGGYLVYLWVEQPLQRGRRRTPAPVVAAGAGIAPGNPV